MFLALDLGETVNSAIENGIDLIENGSLNPNNIDVAFPQVVVSYASEENVKVSNKEKRKANNFNETQKELSEGLEELNNQ